MMTATERIFIQIASYRDPELLPTMCDAVKNASHPENLFFGVCYQEYTDAPDYETVKAFPRCRIIQIDPADAKGACNARALTQTLWQGEEYTLQIDSHARFVPGWDTLALEMLRACGDRAILTSYCPSYDPDFPIQPHPVAHTLGADFFEPYGSLMLMSRCALSQMDHPVPGAFWSGHFSFSEGQVIKDLPYDPHLYFHGEEISYAVRAWTHGYRLFYPHRPVCYHFYTRKGRTTHWEDHQKWFMQDVMSQQRVRCLLGMESSTEGFGKYGLGNARSLKDYEAFSGVDFPTRTISAKAYSGWYAQDEPGLGNNPSQIPPEQDILFVTAFHEIGRGTWLSCRRNRELYLEWFSALAALKNLHTVCYYDRELQTELPPGNYILRDLALQDTFFRTYFEVELEIMQSQAFREWIGERQKNPEHCQPEYSMMTHAKVNFVRRTAQQFPGHSHYAWIDFGIVRQPVCPDAVFDWGRLMDDKIHMQVFDTPDAYPSDPRELCQKSPDALSAALFVIPAALVGWYEQVYEQELRRNHEVKIADDEQNVMLRLAQKYPEYISADRVDFWYDFFYESIC